MRTAVALAALVGANGRAGAVAIDMPAVANGLILMGSIVPSFTLLPVMEGAGVPSNFPPGPDVVMGFDAAGKRLFRQRFQDKIYNYYVFVPLDRAKLRALRRLRVTIGGRTFERTGTRYGRPEARARTVGAERVRVTWNARVFPRLSCHDEGGGSPAPLMLDGDFTAADVRGHTLRCNFSDGVKTVYADVALPIEPPASP